MSALFMQDATYLEACGNRTVLGVASTVDAVIGRDIDFYKLFLRSKTFGRVIDLTAIKEEIACLEPNLKEAEKSFDFFWKTALHLQEITLAARKGMEWLKEQEKEQQMLRLKHARGAILPEITKRILSYVPTKNRLIMERRSERNMKIYVDGLLPQTIYDPALLRPYYEIHSLTRCELELIAKSDIKLSVLEETSLANQIILRHESRQDVTRLKPLMKYSHPWKRIRAYDDDLPLFMDYFNSSFQPRRLHLEELYVSSDHSIDPSQPLFRDGVIPYPRQYQTFLPFESTSLRLVHLPIYMLSSFVSSGVLNTITYLTLDIIIRGAIFNRDALKGALGELPHKLSHLPHLYHLTARIPRRDYVFRNSPVLAKVNSTSLHSLDVDGDDIESVITFLSLFTDCHIDHLALPASLLPFMKSEQLFNDTRCVCVKRFKPEIWLQQERDGDYYFPKMNQMEVHSLYSSAPQPQPRSRYKPNDDQSPEAVKRNREQAQAKDCLQIVRMRAANPQVCRIRYLRLPKTIVTNAQIQAELERYVPSLVLFDPNRTADEG